ncbi:hypothetical protein O6H91_Y191000 [Diphasiastrum complanatum]|nr:hypothetical protein O6H91_Y191000 [Diphasiastrum complanatum]
MKDADDQLVWYAVDPETGRWMRLPPMLNPIEEKLAQAQVAPQQGSNSRCLQAYGRWIIRKIFGNRTRLKGCSAAALDGCLFVVGGCLRAELNSVWRYDACTKEWTSVCTMATPRAFCQTACLHNKLYAVGGLQLGGDDAVYPLQSIEVYDPTTNQWSPVGTFYCARTDVLPATMRAKMPKPMATTVVSYNDQLCLFHSLHSRYVNVRGQLYRPLSHTWSKIPRGMVLGWPAHQSTTQSSAVVNGEIVALDSTSSLDGVSLKLYDSQADEWKILCIKQLPISVLDVIHSEYPCLIAGFMSKLYLVLKQSNGDVVALRADFSNFSDCDVRDWETTAIKKFGSAKPVACQVVDI